MVIHNENIYKIQCKRIFPIITPINPAINNNKTFIMTSTISIIIPTLNAELTIGALLRSITTQEHPSIEVVIVDGGSTDRTLSIVTNFSYPISIYHESSSPANARNIGLSHSTGDYILFLDADMELLHPSSLSSISSPVTYIPFKIIEDTPLETFISKIIQGGTHVYKRSFIGDHTFNTNLGFGEDRNFLHSLPIPSNIPLSPIPIGRHYPHTFSQLARQAEWYGRTIINYLSVTFHTDIKDFIQQSIYILYNITFALFIPLLLLNLESSIFIVSMYMFLSIIRFSGHKLRTPNDFIYSFLYSLWFGIFFTKGFILTRHNKHLGRSK